MNFVKKYILLKGIFPFSELSSDDVAAIADACFEYEFKPSSTVVRKDSMPTHIFFVHAGAIIDSGGTARRIFSAEHVLNFDEYENDARAHPVEGAHCLVLSREHFLAATENCPKILTGLARLKRIERGKVSR